MTATAQLRARTWLNAEVRIVGEMLRRLRSAGLALGVAVILPLVAQAQTAPQTGAQPASERAVVLELYTAQGCASCPPADDMMLELADREDVIALSLHVDYWDYIGWVDSFADPEHGQRQQRYARRHGHSTIYTPQVVINGVAIMEGFRVMQVMETIAAQRRRAPEVSISLTRVPGAGLEISARTGAEVSPLVAMASRRAAMPNAVVGTLSIGEVESGEPPSPSMVSRREPVGEGTYAVQVVRYRAEDSVEIMGGENAGRTARFANIVTSWETVGTWDLMAPLQMTVPMQGDEPVVVIVQEAGQGEIIGAARLR